MLDALIFIPIALLVYVVYLYVRMWIVTVQLIWSGKMDTTWQTFQCGRQKGYTWFALIKYMKDKELQKFSRVWNGKRNNEDPPE
jgi:hypothetical protein